MEPAHTRNIGETRGVILWGSWSAYELSNSFPTTGRHFRTKKSLADF